VHDLGLQRLDGTAHDDDRLQHSSQMRFEHLTARGHGGVPFASKLGKNQHLPYGHAGFAQAQKESDPGQV